MQKELLKIIVCPHCKSKLMLKSFETTEETAEEITEGMLICKCKRKYPIIKGVPRLLPDSLRHNVLKKKYPEFYLKYSEQLKEETAYTATDRKTTTLKKKTLHRFGYEWTQFSKLYKEYETQFIDWIYPVKPDFFKNKLVLDAGCGIGRHLYCAAKFGAKAIGIDLSEAVDVAYKNTKQNKKIHIIQADIFNMPFKNETFDYVYCIGVLHHLPNPSKGFKKLTETIKNQGAISIWVYGKEGNLTLKILNPLRKYFFSKIPIQLTEIIALLITSIIYPTALLIYAPLKKMELPKFLLRLIPQWHFFNYLTAFNFRIAHSIIFDQLLAPIAFYHTKKEVKKWLEENNLQQKTITRRNHNSWRGFAIKL